MSPDGRRLLDEGVTVYEGPVAEGTKFMKRNGWYYLVIPEGGVGQGWQTVLRSRSIYGPYERRIVLEQGSTKVNGPHQGALVDTPDGKWWFYHFQETPVLGRVVHLQPARWQDDWPLIGVDYDGNGVGEPVAQWTKPIESVNGLKASGLQSVSSDFYDDFSASSLSPVWQWNHNPSDAHWSLSERKGWLMLEAQFADSLKTSRNMLTQKVIGYKSQSTTLVTLSGSCNAGLFCSGKQFRGVGLCSEGIFVETGGKRQIVQQGRYEQLWLRVTNDCLHNSHRFYYSTDGENFVAAGESFPMRAGFWKGIRVGLFCYSSGHNMSAGRPKSANKAYFDSFEQKINQ